MLSCSRTDVDDVVGGLHDVFVMFDDDDGVADFGQLLEIGDKQVVVAGMEADGRLVQNVDDAFEPGSYLGREADALGFPAGERVRPTGKGDVIEPDPGEEFETFDDVLLDIAHDLLFGSGELDPGEEFEGRADRKFGQFADMLASDLHGKVFPLETVAVAFRTGDFGDVLGNAFHVRIFGVRFAVTAGEIGNDALVLGFEGLLPVGVLFEIVFEFVDLAGRSEKHPFAGELGQLGKRGVEVYFEAPAHGLENGRVVGMGSPRKNRSFRERKARIDDVFLQKRDFGSESVAAEAGSVVGIETEIRYGEVGNGVVAFGTRTLLSKTAEASGGKVFQKAFAVSGLVRKFDAVPEAFGILFVFFARLVLGHEPVNHEESPFARGQIRTRRVAHRTERVSNHETDEAFFQNLRRDF